MHVLRCTCHSNTARHSGAQKKPAPTFSKYLAHTMDASQTVKPKCRLEGSWMMRSLYLQHMSISHHLLQTKRDTAYCEAYPITSCTTSVSASVFLLLQALPVVQASESLSSPLELIVAWTVLHTTLRRATQLVSQFVFHVSTGTSLALQRWRPLGA